MPAMPDHASKPNNKTNKTLGTAHLVRLGAAQPRGAGRIEGKSRRLQHTEDAPSNAPRMASTCVRCMPWAPRVTNMMQLRIAAAARDIKAPDDGHGVGHVHVHCYIPHHAAKFPYYHFSVPTPASLALSSIDFLALGSNAGCSRIAWNSCVPRSAFVRGRCPLGASRL